MGTWYAKLGRQTPRRETVGFCIPQDTWVHCPLLPVGCWKLSYFFWYSSMLLFINTARKLSCLRSEIISVFMDQFDFEWMTFTMTQCCDLWGMTSGARHRPRYVKAHYPQVLVWYTCMDMRIVTTFFGWEKNINSLMWRPLTEGTLSRKGKKEI